MTGPSWRGRVTGPGWRGRPAEAGTHARTLDQRREAGTHLDQRRRAHTPGWCGRVTGPGWRRAYNGETVSGISHLCRACRRGVTCVTRLSPRCRKIVPQCHEMSQMCRQMSPRCHGQVTYLSHAVTSCRNNCHTNHAVSQSVNTSVDM